MATLAAIGGCAGTGDRLEPFNRAMLTFNDAVDTAILGPATDVYTFVVPGPIRGLVGNFFENLDTARVIGHNLLQGKPARAHDATGRFIANSTLGVGGLFDVATGFGLEHQDEDLGQTLGVWGVERGAYIVLPLLGPTTVRDGLDIPFRLVTNPFFYAETPVTISTGVTRGLNRRAESERQLKRLDEASVDRYVFLREAFLQRRRFLINDGEVPPEDLDDGRGGVREPGLDGVDEGDLDLLDEPSGASEGAPTPAGDDDAEGAPEAERERTPSSDSAR